MPHIRPSSDIRNNYNEISNFCHKNEEPIYITKNGKGDLAILSIEMYERLIGKYELNNLLTAGINDIQNNNTISATDVFGNLESNFINENL